ncbi:hypothetical protein V6Z11_D05G160000 [Gossypium hirsutum]
MKSLRLTLFDRGFGVQDQSYLVPHLHNIVAQRIKKAFITALDIVAEELMFFFQPLLPLLSRLCSFLVLPRLYLL